MTSFDDSSPGGTSPSIHSTRSLVQLPQNSNKSNYVQRFKVLRDRNKSLPKLDFNAKASGVPKKLQGVGSFGRSQTYDSMKLPSISASSVVTGISGKSVHSDGYRRKDNKNSITILVHFERWKCHQNNIQRTPRKDGHSEPLMQDYQPHKDLVDLSNLMSKQQENKDNQADNPNPPAEEETNKPKKGQRFESIAAKKSLTRRHRMTEKSHRGKTKERSIIAQAEKHLKQTVEKELLVLQGKDARKETLDSGFADGLERRKDHPLVSPRTNHTNDVTSNSDVITGTSDDCTLSATLTTESHDNTSTIRRNDVTTKPDVTRGTQNDVTTPVTMESKPTTDSPPVSNQPEPDRVCDTKTENSVSPLAQTI